jgi:hypothetical protein
LLLTATLRDFDGFSLTAQHCFVKMLRLRMSIPVVRASKIKLVWPEEGRLEKIQLLRHICNSKNPAVA